MPVRSGFERLFCLLTGQPARSPSERERLAAEVEARRAKHMPVRDVQERLKRATHAELAGDRS